MVRPLPPASSRFISSWRRLDVINKDDRSASSIRPESHFRIFSITHAVTFCYVRSVYLLEYCSTYVFVYLFKCFLSTQTTSVIILLALEAIKHAIFHNLWERVHHRATLASPKWTRVALAWPVKFANSVQGRQFKKANQIFFAKHLGKRVTAVLQQRRRQRRPRS